MTHDDPTPADDAALSDVTGILTPAQLEQIVAGYDEAFMNAAAESSIIGRYAPSAGLVRFVGDRYYRAPYSFPPREREMVILTTLSARSPGGLFLAIHVYWALALETAPDRIANTLLLAGSYTGLPDFTASITSMETVLLVLKRLAETEPIGPVRSRDVIPALAAAWRSVPPMVSLRQRASGT